MHIRIDEIDYIGTRVGILDRLRQEADQGLSTVGDYICFVQDNVQQRTGQPYPLDGGDTEKRAHSLIHRLEALGALEIMEE